MSRVNTLALHYKLFCEEFLTALGELAKGRSGTAPAVTPAAATPATPAPADPASSQV